MPLFHWHVSIFLNTQSLEAFVSGANKQQNCVLATTWMFLRIITTIAQNSAMGVYFKNSNPLLFAEFSLPRTKIRPKHSEGVVWAQSKGHFRTQHPWKPLHNMLPVWPYLWILKFWNFLSLGVIYLIGGQLATSRQSWVVVYIYEQRSNHPIIIYLIRCISLAFSPHFLSLHIGTFMFLYSSGSITSAAAAAHETSDCNQGLVGMYKSSIEEDPKPLTPQSPCYNQVSITLYFLIHFTWTATNDVFTCHQYYKPNNYLLYF